MKPVPSFLDSVLSGVLLVHSLPLEHVPLVCGASSEQQT